MAGQPCELHSLLKVKGLLRDVPEYDIRDNVRNLFYSQRG